MPDKIAAHFSKPRVTRYSFQRLSHCRKCGTFTSLDVTSCPACGRSGLVPVTRIGRLHHGLLFVVELLLLAGGVVGAAFLAKGTLQLALCILLGAGLLTAYLFSRKQYAPSARQYRLRNLLESRSKAIAEGLDADEKSAEADYEDGRYKECYEKLRDVGQFLYDDRLRGNKVLCLNRFVLRKDMFLELESLVPRKYSKAFNTYLLEISRVKPELIREQTMHYVLRYRGEIEKTAIGREVLTAVAAAALRRRSNLVICQFLIADYAEYLPRERFRRLCMLLADPATDSFPALLIRAKEVAVSLYPNDAEIIGLL